MFIIKQGCATQYAPCIKLKREFLPDRDVINECAASSTWMLPYIFPLLSPRFNVNLVLLGANAPDPLTDFQLSMNLDSTSPQSTNNDRNIP